MMPFDFEIVAYRVVVSAATGMSTVKSTNIGTGISITMFTCNRFKSYIDLSFVSLSYDSFSHCFTV